MILRKLSETSTKITLGWDPVPGAAGYRYQSASTDSKWSHTWDGTVTQVTFSKAAWYKVEALGVEDAGQFPAAAPPPPPPTEWQRVAMEHETFQHPGGPLRYGSGTSWFQGDVPAGPVTCNNTLFGDPLPTVLKECQIPAGTAPPPPSGNKLRRPPPALGAGGVEVVTRTVTNANRRDGFLRNGQGRDLRIICGEPLTGQMDEIIGWRHVVAIGGEIHNTLHGVSGLIIPRNLSPTGVFHLEGWRVTNAAGIAADAITLRDILGVVQIQNCFIQTTDRDFNFHSDNVQTQVARVESLHFDMCTFQAGYQGWFIANEPSVAFQSQVKELVASRCNFRDFGNGPDLFVYKEIPSKTGVALGPWTFTDMWATAPNVYPTFDFHSWQGGSQKFGAFLRADAQGQYVEWSKPGDIVPTGSFAGQQAGDCGISGVLRIGQPADFGAAAGIGYTSPGYV